jgi:hypothetical protein
MNVASIYIENGKDGEQMDKLKEFIDELIYRSYKYNRQRSPEIPAEKWKTIFQNATEMENRLQSESN